MPVPKRKLSRSRRDSRSADKFIRPKSISLCKTEGCKEAVIPHRVCAGCGIYKGKQVLSVKSREKNIKNLPESDMKGKNDSVQYVKEENDKEKSGE